MLNLLAILRNCWRQEATFVFIGLQSIKATEISARIPARYFTIKLYIPSAGSVHRCVLFLLRPFHFILYLSSRSPKGRVPIQSVLKI